MRDHDENEYLCEAFAAASSANGDHCIAMLDRLISPAGGALARNLVEGAVESAFALVIYHFDRRLEGIKAIRAEGFDPTQITVPGNHEALLSAEEKLCLRWRAKLLKMIPKDRRFRYALDP